MLTEFTFVSLSPDPPETAAYTQSELDKTILPQTNLIILPIFTTSDALSPETLVLLLDRIPLPLKGHVKAAASESELC